MTTVLHVRAFQDNYIWLIRADTRPAVAIVDPGDAAPVLNYLQHEQLIPVAVLCTHHHDDHVGGAQALADKYSLPVYGPATEPIDAITHPLREGDRVTLPALSLTLNVIDIPGHTRGHIAYVGDDKLFCGDTLFSAGCGRLFEGTAEQMYRSLSCLAALPDTTAVYCGHEYTLANLRFAMTVEPNNTETTTYYRQAEQRQEQGQPTLPSTIGRERQVNPFLRTTVPTVRETAEKHANERLNDDVAVFAALRRWKDHFRG
ncbi:MAG: hydroxyacylglutathione hydrolase [Gammaproteobacteria bacterium]|nr:hydroxyacylglutathione hydrolase [Gammaproteobacteria bacterium]